MDYEKAKRLVTAGVSSGIILLFVLLSVLICQCVMINSKKREIENLKGEIQRLEQDIEKNEDAIDVWLSEWKITERANELGLFFGGDK